jgi:fumarylacetoacetase
VLTDALEPFLVQGLEPGNRESLLPYLREEQAANVYDIRLEVDLIAQDAAVTETICRTSAKNLLFSFPQMIAHHSVNGCAMSSGDLLGSGTISGTEPGSQGSMLEQTKNGKETITVGSKSRTFLEDGDEVVIRGMCGEPGRFVGFGECRGRIEPTLEM